MQAEIKGAYWKLFDTEDLTTKPGPKLVELIDNRIAEMAARYAATYPAAMKCLTLVWAVLDRASRGWRGLTMTSDGLRLLQDLRRSLLDPPRQVRPRTVAATQDDSRPENAGATA